MTQVVQDIFFSETGTKDHFYIIISPSDAVFERLFDDAIRC